MSAQMNFAAERYRQTEIQSRTPLELVVMLYDGALRAMDLARDAITRGDIPTRRDQITKALALVAELQNTLNLDGGGAIAQSLDDLYGFVTSRLLDATLKQDVGPIDDAARVVRVLREGFSSIATPVPATAQAAR